METQTQKEFKRQMAELNKENGWRYPEYSKPVTAKRNVRNLVILAVIAAFLIATNPAKVDFNEWAKGQLTAKANSDLERGITSLLGTAVIDAMTIRKDYIFFSIYEINDGNKTEAVLGISKIFIPLTKGSTV